MNWNKLISGRWWLTFISGWVFAYCACWQLIPSEATIAIITSVFVSYFQRNDRIIPTGETNEKTN